MIQKKITSQMKTLSHLDRLLKIQKLQTINNLPFGSEKSKNLIQDFTNYFDLKNEKFSSLEMFRIVHWFEIFEELKHIFSKYYTVEPNNEKEVFLDYQSYPLVGAFINLVPKYKDKFVKQVYTIYIKSAYPQQMDKMFLSGMRCNDPFLPFIFHLVYRGIQKKTPLRKIFINFLYGILCSEGSKLKLNQDIKKVPQFYNNFWKKIDQKLYYSVDTDEIMCSKANIKKITDKLQEERIEFEIEEACYDVLFLAVKRHIKIRNGVFQARGLKNVIKTI